VYLGLPEFSLRAKTGFDFSDLKSGIEYAHKLQKKVYVTVNVFAHESHIEKLPAFLKKLKTCQPDAIILSDSGVLMLVKKYLPSTPIHLSTQMNTLNSEAVKFWKKNGVKRIILGREATLS
jgi:U32 family peptidase